MRAGLSENWYLRSRFSHLRLRANGSNNPHHCCTINVGRCCMCVGSGVQTDATINPRRTKEFIRTRWNVSVCSRSNWNLKVLVFMERGKPEYPEKNLSEQGTEPTTNSTHIWHRRQDSNPGHIGGGASALTTAPPFFPIMFQPAVHHGKDTTHKSL